MKKGLDPYLSHKSKSVDQGLKKGEGGVRAFEGSEGL